MKQTLSLKLKDKIVSYSSGIGLFLVFILCFFYSVFASNFAKLNIKFPLLDFPIFIGEIILGIVFILFLLQVRFIRYKIKTIHYFILIFIMLFFYKAMQGYFKWGALAFRNAALFYYSLFSFITFQFLKSIKIKNIDKSRVSIAVVIFLLLVFIFKQIEYYFIYTYLGIISFLCLLSLAHKKLLNLILIVPLIIFSIFWVINYGSRTNIVSFIVSLFFVIFFFPLFLKIRRKQRIIVFISVIMLAMIFSLKLIVHNEKVKSLFSLSSYWREYKKKIKLFETINSSSGTNKIHIPNIPKFVEKPGIYTEEKTFKEALKDKKENILSRIKLQIKKEENNNYNTKNKAKVGGPVISIRNKVKIKKFVKKPALYREENMFKDKVTSASEKEKSKKFGKNDNNIIWRMFVIRDAIKEWLRTNIIFGVDFGKPFRSKTIETLGMGGSGYWIGWIEPHNSYIHMLYRFGLFGAIFIIGILYITGKMFFCFLRNKSLEGLILSSILIYWIVAANFSVILELPYYAIPFWSIMGFSLFYSQSYNKKISL